MAQVGNTRRSWHLRANALVFGYAALGLITLLAPLNFDKHRWLVVHLFLLGSVTNAIVTWTEHFTVTLLRVPQPSRGGSAWRLVVLNLAVVALLVGVSISNSPLVIAGAILLVIVIGTHSVNLYRLSNKALQNRFAGTVRFYLAAATCLVLGIVLGTLAAFQKEGSVHLDSFHVSHVHANLLGWIGLTVLGTFFTFWPTILRTKMVDGVMKAARRALPFLFSGVFVSSIALAMDQRLLTILGMVIYAIGLAISSVPFIRTWMQKPPRDFAALSVSFSATWLVLGVLADILALSFAKDLPAYAGLLDHFVPAFLFGFVGQLLLGALTFLVPVILGGGPSSVRRHIVQLSLFWKTRFLFFNLGALLLALGDGLTQVGYALLALSLGTFIGLVIYTVRAGARVSNDSGQLPR